MNYHDMLDIMQSLHKYVPCEIIQGDYGDETATSSVQVATTSMHYLIFGGDQVTVSRVRGCHGIRKNSITPQGTLQGLQPVIEDWHAKMCLPTVLYIFTIIYFICWLHILPPPSPPPPPPPYSVYGSGCIAIHL